MVINFMKKNHSLLLLILSLFYFAQGQNTYSGKITYLASYDNTLIDEKSNIGNKEGIKGANEMIKSSSNVVCTLSFNQNESSYKVNKEMDDESKNKLNITYLFAGGKNVFYYQRDSLVMLQSNESLGKKLIIKRDIPNWIITKETKKINELVCIKAYTIKNNKDNADAKDKIDAVAWFCPDIALGYGPMEYFGLPGLIIELKFSKMTFIANEIDLNNNDVEIEKLDATNAISIKEFNAIARKKAPDFFGN